MFLFNSDEELEAVVQDKDIISAIHTEKLTGENFLEIEVPSWVDASEGKHFGFIDLDDDLQLFEIKEINEEDTIGTQIKTCYCEHVYYEMRDNVIEDKRSYQTTALLALDDALSPTDCRWQIGDCDILSLKSTNFYYQSSLEALQDIRERWTYIDSYGKTTKGRLKYRLAFSGSEITARYVDFEKLSEEWTGKRFVAGKDIESMNRIADTNNLLTACYGRGKGEEILNNSNDGSPQAGSSTYGRRTTFADVIWGGSNQLENGDFETGDLTGWTGDSAPIVTTPAPFKGEYCAQIYDYGTDTTYTITSDAVYDYPYDTEYNCSAWIYTPSGAGRVSGFLVVDWYSDATFRENHSVKFEAVGEQWTKIDLLQQDGTRFKSYTSGADMYAKVTLTVESGAAKDLFFDNVRFGDTVTKPSGQEWIEDSIAKGIWGRAGGTKNRMGIYTNEEQTDPEALLQETWQYLQDNNEPRLSYEISVADLETKYPHEAVRLGDVVYVLDENFETPIEVTARVIGINRNLIRPEDTEIEIGNFVNDAADVMKKQQDIERKISEREAVWDRGTAFESSNGATRIRMIEAEEGEYQSYIKYEDDSTPPNLVGYFSPNEFSYKKIRADEYVGQNIINVVREKITFYVDSDAGDDNNDGSISSPFRTMNRLLSEGTLPRLLLNDVDLYILDDSDGSTPYNEHVEFIGFIGPGQINMYIHSKVILNGSLAFRGCSAKISVYGDYDEDPTYWSHINCTSSELSPIRVDSCQRVYFHWLWVNVDDRTELGAYIQASKVVLDDCVIENVNSDASAAAIAAAFLGEVYVNDCQGDNPNGYSLSVAEGGKISVKGSRPNAGQGAANYVPYCLLDSGGMILPSAQDGLTPVSGAASPGTAPSVTAQTEFTCTASDSSTYEYKYSRYRTETHLYQGSWESGNRAGVILFNGSGETFTDVRTAATTIKSAKMTIRRKSSGGYSSARALHLYGLSSTTFVDPPSPTAGVNLGQVATIRWGEELTFSMPQAFLTGVAAGTIKSLCMYDLSGEPFMLFDGYDEFDITVTFLYE
jgi:phage minor structural protein